MHHNHIPEHEAARVLAAFGLHDPAPRRDITLPGSPQRCVARTAVQDGAGRLWMLERLAPAQADHREAVARLLHALAEAGLHEVPAYLPLPDGTFALCEPRMCWQVSPYVPGDPLPQPGYIEDPERGIALARFIARLHRHADGLSAATGPAEPFSLPAYIRDLMATIEVTRSDLVGHLRPVVRRLAPLFEAWDDLPTALAHGDCHPLNVIWKGSAVRAVIDWEFCGPRPALYDAANLLGCVGFELPQSLGRGLATAFVRTLRDHAVVTPDNAPWLPPMLLALRFAWLSEWLRLGDPELLDMELAYLPLIAANLEALERVWEIAD